MKNILIVMSQIYLPNGVDWMDYDITKENQLTYHHIIKKENNGIYCKDNGAMLTNCAHVLLHYYERHDPHTYMLLNGIFKDLNNHNKPPDESYWHELDKIYKNINAEKMPIRSKKRYW